MLFSERPQAKLETKALKAKRPGFTDDRYYETSYYIENGKQKPFLFAVIRFGIVSSLSGRDLPEIPHFIQVNGFRAAITLIEEAEEDTSGSKGGCQVLAVIVNAARLLKSSFRHLVDFQLIS